MQQREVVRVAGEIKKRLNENGTESLYALINNAGCARSRYMTTEDGYEQQFALNHLAGFRLTHELLPYPRRTICTYASNASIRPVCIFIVASQKSTINR